MAGQTPHEKPSEEGAVRLAEYFSTTFGREKILIYPILNSGAHYFTKYEKLIGQMKLSFPPYQRKDIKSQKKERARGEVRRILTSAKRARPKNSIKNLVLFDNTIQTGRSMLGACEWALTNKERIGFEQLYIVALHDWLRMAHFSLGHPPMSYLGPLEIMKHGVPDAMPPVLPYTETLKKLEPLASAIAEYDIRRNLEKTYGALNGVELSSHEDMLLAYQRLLDAADLLCAYMEQHGPDKRLDRFFAEEFLYPAHRINSNLANPNYSSPERTAFGKMSEEYWTRYCRIKGFSGEPGIATRLYNYFLGSDPSS